MKVNLNIELIEKIIDAWESVSDINQNRDCIETKKEEKEMYKKVLDKLKGASNVTK